ncbi:hypothetical protein HYFRA_00001603 [Hymenoscyphus fraxineus]|uniref:Ubiquitin 3 binding protein But2 C-terminal domain-containing protein n=1 Tax=Hymenoscyphus fraxineus TaxID=746836 RepID=A0A9N9LA14_9HELO|nr:hypothetical protein HYFRA_00001603 [Hymenoscyphus fraxineus]
MHTLTTLTLTLLSLLTLVTAQCRNLMPVAAQTVSSSEPDRVFPNVVPGAGQTGTVIITDNSDLFPPTAQTCYIAIADPLHTRTYSTLLSLPPTINFLSYTPNAFHGVPITYNTAYNGNRIANPHNAAINALLWDGSLARKQVPCPGALPGEGFGEAYFGMELNILGLGGVVPGRKSWSMSETGREGGVWNGVFMQVDC